MNSPQKFTSSLSCLLFFGALLTSHSAVLTVLPGLNNAPITEVTYSIGGIDVVQAAEATDVVVADRGDFTVNIKTVRIQDGGEVELKFFNTEGAIAIKLNPQLQAIGGIGVFENGANTSPLDLNAYANALAAVSQDTNLRHFGYHDYLTPGPPTPGVPDYDLHFYRALNPDDYLVVAERWGNSFFEVTALMENGEPYAGANVLRIGGNGGDLHQGYQVHDWNTGFAAATNVPSQAQVLSAISVAKFFSGTAYENLQNLPAVYGLRIDNDGEADVKILGASADTFLNNPINSLVPEPSAFLMSLIGALFFLSSRSRIR